MLQALRRAATQDTGRTGQTAVSMEHMEKRKRNSETAGAAAQGGTPAGSRKHAAEPQGRRMERGAVAPGSAWALVTRRVWHRALHALRPAAGLAGDRHTRAPLEAVAEEKAGTPGRPGEAAAKSRRRNRKQNRKLQRTGSCSIRDGSGAPGREPAALTLKLGTQRNGRERALAAGSVFAAKEL
ncbi:MAG: hypothetical protein ACLS37_11855 [Alistipes sp.]